MIGIGKQENGRRQGLFDMIAADSSHWSGGKETFFSTPPFPPLQPIEPGKFLAEILPFCAPGRSFSHS